MRPAKEEKLLYGGFFLIFASILLAVCKVLAPTQMTILLLLGIFSMVYSSILQYFRHRSLGSET